LLKTCWSSGGSDASTEFILSNVVEGLSTGFELRNRKNTDSRKDAKAAKVRRSNGGDTVRRLFFFAEWMDQTPISKFVKEVLEQRKK
jgi:hypothetical protein